MAPEFDDLRIDAEDVVGMAPVYRQHPVIQDLALLVVPTEALELHAASQFSKCDDREKYLATVGGGILEKCEHARVRPGTLALLADDRELILSELFTIRTGLGEGDRQQCLLPRPFLL